MSLVTRKPVFGVPDQVRLKPACSATEAHGRHSMLSFLSSLPFSVLRILDTEANKFYDRNHQLYDAALLTRCYTQHALRPFIDSEINHKRHFIKIPFINKGIEFIDLPSIFKDRSVTSSIPAYFRGARWLSGRVSDSGARGPGFETYRRRVVSLSKTLYSLKVLVNYPGSDGSVPI